MTIFLFLFIFLFQSGCDENLHNQVSDTIENIHFQKNQIDSLKQNLSHCIDGFSNLDSKIQALEVSIVRLTDKYSNVGSKTQNLESKIDISEDSYNKMNSQIQTLGVIIDSLTNNHIIIKSQIYKLQNEKMNHDKYEDSEIKTHLHSIPFGPETSMIDLSDFIENKIGAFEIELVTIKRLDFTALNDMLDFQITLSTELFDFNDVSQNGLLSYYQYSKPDKGIINSTSSKLIIDSKSPFLFLKGNDLYKISGNLILKISGKF